MPASAIVETFWAKKPETYIFLPERKKNLYFFLIAVDLLTPIQNVVNTCDQWEFSVATTILKENICFYNFENEVDNRVGN